jgi:parallel beta-helix repeat protein
MTARSRRRLLCPVYRSPEPLEPRALMSAYFVSSAAGSDTNPGTADAPFRTIQRAADLVQAGDVVTVRSGSYAGFVVGWDGGQDGTADAPITFHADPGVNVIDRNDKTPDGINLEGADYVVVEGFYIDNSLGHITRAGIRAVANRGAVIRNNAADACGRWGIFTGFAEDVTIENNVCSRAQAEHGIYVSNSADRPTVRGNVCWGNRAAGIHMNGDASQGGDGVISGALVENNVIYGNGVGGGSGINCDGVQDSVFRNNLLYGNHASGISLYRIDAAEGAKNNLVVNNTIVMPADGRWAVNVSGGSTGNVLFNNVLYQANTFRGSVSITADSLAGFASDYNVTDGKFSTDGGDTNMSLAAWRAATGGDAHSVVAAPAARPWTSAPRPSPAATPRPPTTPAAHARRAAATTRAPWNWAPAPRRRPTPHRAAAAAA